MPMAAIRARMERDIRRLKQASLVTDKTIEVSRKEDASRCHAYQARTSPSPKDGPDCPTSRPTYHGLAKPREAKHDAVLYRLYQKEASRIARRRKARPCYLGL